jgi:hypothetical protein
MFCDDPKIGLYERRSDGSFIWYPFGPASKGVMQTLDQIQRRRVLTIDYIVMSAVLFFPLIVILAFAFIFDVKCGDGAYIPRLPATVLAAMVPHLRIFWPVYAGSRAQWEECAPIYRGYDARPVDVWPIAGGPIIGIIIGYLTYLYFENTFWTPKGWQYFEGVVAGAMLAALFTGLGVHAGLKVRRVLQSRP